MSSPPAQGSLAARSAVAGLGRVFPARAGDGWLIRRGFPQRPSCSDHRCDDGGRLDTEAGCQNCGNVIHLRRGWRTRAAADVDQEQPRLDNTVRSRAVEARLHEIAMLDAEDYMWCREQAREEQARRDAPGGSR